MLPLDTLTLDIRYALRAVRKAPGLAVAVVVTMALAIGASTAIFTIVHALLIEPLPYRAADRLTFIWAESTAAGYARLPLTGPELRALRGSANFNGFAGIGHPARRH